MNTKALKQKILDLAIHGKLLPLAKVEKIRKEDPASILLEKIRVEKEAKIAKGELKKDKKDSFIFLGDDKRHYEKFADGSIKDIEDEIPFDIPDGWSWVRLSLLGEYKKGPFGSALTKSMFVPKAETTIKVYEQKNAIHKNYSLGDYYITKEYFEEKMKSFEVFPGDIIVSCAGTIGETYILPKNIERGIINQALMRMKITDKINTEYFLMFFDHILKEESVKSGKGTAIKNIPPFDIFKQFLIPLPPLSEQQLIVSEIEKIFAQIDLLEHNKTYLQTAIKQAKSKILDLAIHAKLVPQDPNDEPASILLEKIRVEKEAKIAKGELKKDKKDSFIFLGDDKRHYEKFADGSIKDIEDEIPFDIPDNWQWCRLGEIGNIVTGSTPSKTHNEYYGNDYPFYKPTDLEQGLNTVKAEDNLSEIGFLQARQLPKNSVLVTCIGATIGKTGLIKAVGACNQQINAIIPNNLIIPVYIFYACISDFMQDLIISNSSSTTLPILNKSKFATLLFPLPPLSEQQRIVSKIEEIFAILDRINSELGTDI